MVNERSRNWKLGKQAASRCYSRTYKEIKKAKKQMQGLSAQKIQKILNCCKSFLGCFASDQLESLSLSFFHVLLLSILTRMVCLVLIGFVFVLVSVRSKCLTRLDSFMRISYRWRFLLLYNGLLYHVTSNSISAFNPTRLSCVAFTAFSLYFCVSFVHLVKYKNILLAI